MKKLILALALTLSTAAFATNNTPNTNISNDSRASALAYSASQSNAESRSTAYGGYGVAVAGGGSASGGASGAANSLTIEYPKQVGAIGLGSLYPTAPCMGTSNLGGGNGFFSIGVGSSWTDDECGIRETARSFSGLGLKDDAVSVLCSSKYAAIAPICKNKVEAK